MAKVIDFTKYTSAAGSNSGPKHRVDIKEQLQNARAYMQSGNTKDALAAFAIVLESDPDNFDALFYTGNIYFNNNQMARAIPLYDRIITCYPSYSYLPYLNYLRALLKCRKFDKMLEVAGTSLKYFPFQAEPLKLIGISRFQLGDLNESLKYLKKYLERDNFDKESLYFVAQIYQQLEIYDAAIMYYRRLLKMIPDDNELLKIIGILYLRRNDHANATRFLERNFLSTHDFNVGKELSWLYTVSGRLEEAEQTLLKLLKTSPHDLDLLVSVGEVYLGLNRLAEARKFLKNAFVLNSEHPVVNLKLAACCARLGDTGQAVYLYKKVIAVQPEFFDPYFDLYNLLEDSGDIKELHKLKLTILSRKWELPEYYLLLARICLADGKNDETIRFLKKALKFEGDFRQRELAEDLSARLCKPARRSRKKKPEQQK
ncbi:MAG: tetratricopeptide repeat protein [Candidatus Wallbacteria bacterium]|nr:tetratricopeptide repeat protein [Candidatus Wallbacteria bacterium]